MNPDERWLELDYKSPDEETKSILAFFDKYLVGQERAKSKLANKIVKYNHRLRKPNKPASVCLFPGPSGVGKTFLVKLCAQLFFGNMNALTRIDCSELQEKHTVSRLLGSPPGYIGYGEEPKLSQNNIDKWGYDASVPPEIKAKMRELKKQILELETRLGDEEFDGLNLNNQQTFGQKGNEMKSLFKMQSLFAEVKRYQKELNAVMKEHPYIPGAYKSVLLFDEVEKMHPDVLKILLQILDTATVTLATGKETSFRNSFIFLTSNIGSSQLTGLLEDRGVVGFKTGRDFGDLDKLIYKTTLEAIQKSDHFPTELIGRIGKENIVVFRALKDSEIRKIIDLQLEIEKAAIIKQIPFEIIFSQALKDFLFEESRDPVNRALGARPIENIIQHRIAEPLLNLIIKGQNGGIIAGVRVNVDIKDGELIIKRADRPAAMNEHIQDIQNRFRP